MEVNRIVENGLPVGSVSRMNFTRSSGILLHPTSLPGKYGIGDFGPQAYQWIDFLSNSGCSLWQILPLGPTGYGDSPYQCFSALAGNPLLISPELLIADDLLHPDDLVDMPEYPMDIVEYGEVIPWKQGLLDKAFFRFDTKPNHKIKDDYEEFYVRQKEWLDDFALFMALKETYGGLPWVDWAADLRSREKTALSEARKKYYQAIQRQNFRQFLFFRQWHDLRQYAKNHSVQIIGDVPIFVAHDSADVWVNPELFYLNQIGNPEVVAGVPPDYFSPTGQLWGNPLYNWKAHQQSDFRWWVERLTKVCEMVDIIRLDHFRGFAGYWEVKSGSETAEKGRWVPAPGMEFLNKIIKEIEGISIIAEDLGVITPDVVNMREYFGFPGMKILQFAFEGDPKDQFLPHNYPVNCVVYTGTHDNDTARGWYERVSPESVEFYREYLHRDGSDVAWDMIRACWSSTAVYSLAPMQDFLDLGNMARMNYPGNPGGNWKWRMKPEDMDDFLGKRIARINYLYDRQSTSTIQDITV